MGRGGGLISHQIFRRPMPPWTDNSLQLHCDKKPRWTVSSNAFLLQFPPKEVKHQPALLTIIVAVILNLTWCGQTGVQATQLSHDVQRSISPPLFEIVGPRRRRSSEGRSWLETLLIAEWHGTWQKWRTNTKRRRKIGATLWQKWLKLVSGEAF